jgi:aspartyl/glutamyl-tRNA(Asn/Gln) amidotransferase C subunit
MNNVFRADLVKPGLDREAVLANAPQTRNNQFVVPKIVE